MVDFKPSKITDRWHYQPGNVEGAGSKSDKLCMKQTKNAIKILVEKYLNVECNCL